MAADGVSNDPEVYLAAAMVAARFGINVDAALQRLTRAACAEGVAREQLARRIVESPTFDQGALDSY